MAPRNETLISETERKSWVFFVLYCISAAILLGVSTFVRWDTIRRFLDFQSAVELRDWRLRNILVYVGAAVLTAIIMFRFLRKSAVSKVEGHKVRDKVEKYGEFKASLSVKAFLIQLILLGITLAIPVFAFGGGFIIIPYHLVRVGIYHAVIWLITVIAIFWFDPENSGSGTSTAPAKGPSRWNK